MLFYYCTDFREEKKIHLQERRFQIYLIAKFQAIKRKQKETYGNATDSQESLQKRGEERAVSKSERQRSLTSGVAMISPILDRTAGNRCNTRTTAHHATYIHSQQTARADSSSVYLMSYTLVPSQSTFCAFNHSIKHQNICIVLFMFIEK